MKKIILVCVFCGIIQANVQAQSKERIIARAGKSEITSSEFLERFELTPWPKKQDGRTNRDAQTGFLHTLIAEKLLAQEAQRLGLDTSREISEAFSSLEKMYVRDALFRQEISKKVILPKAIENKAAGRNRFSLKAAVLSSSSAGEIIKIHKELMAGLSFDSVQTGPGLVRKDTLAEIKYGDMSEKIEDALYSLNLNGCTEPIKEKNVWFIFKLIQKSDRIVSGGAKREQTAAEALRKLRERETEKAYQDYYRRFFSGRKVETDGLLFFSLSEKIISILQDKKKRTDITEEDRNVLKSTDFTMIEKAFGTDSLNLPFVVLDEQPVKLGSFLKELASEGFTGITAEPRLLRMQLDSRVKRFIELELLGREGYRQGLQNLPEVKRSVRYWKESYLAQKLKGLLLDSSSVSGKKLIIYPGRTAAEKTVLINLIEIFSDSLSTVEKVLNELNNNADISELAVKYSKLPDAGKTKGETGFIPAHSAGEKGRIASGMNTGEIYGPMKTDNGYLIFKLNGKKEAAEDTLNVSAGKNDNTGKEMISRNFTKKLTEYTAGLAKRYGFDIDNKALAESGTLNLNIFAYRHMGFGGKLLAVPYTVPFTEWFDKWKEDGSQLP